MAFDLKEALGWRFRLLKKKLEKKFKLALYWIDKQIDKKDEQWAFPVCYLNHHLFDNARPIFEKLADDPSIKKVVLYRSVKPTFHGSNIECIKLNSVRGLWAIFTSGVVFVRHCAPQDVGFPLDNDSRLIVNLWHGLPLKKVGIQNIPNSITGIDPLGATISCGPTDTQTMIDSFVYANSNNVFMTGFPRNDLMLCDEAQMWPAAKSELDKIQNRLNGRKLILFAPTYRASWESWENTKTFYQFKDEELKQLTHLANQFDAVIGIRTHLREERSVLSAFGDIEVMSFNDITETALVLRAADVLITDYSSLVFDYLLTKRPVLSFAFDADVYGDGRGFIYALEDVFPNGVCYTFESLAQQLEIIVKASDTGTFDEHYKRILEFFHRHTDHDASMRVITKIRERLSSD